MKIMRYKLILAALPLAFAAIGGAWAELPAPDATIEAQTATIAAPVREEATLLDMPPQLTEAQRTRLEAMLDRTSLPGPPLRKAGQAAVESTLAAGAETLAADNEAESSRLDDAKTEESQVQPAPEASGDFVIFREKNLMDYVPQGYVSNVMEASVGVGSKYGLYTGNWFALRTENAGRNWSYVNPWSGFGDFCCDQRTLYEPSRDMFLWMRMGLPDVNGENVFKLSVSKNAFGSAYWTYTIAPTSVNQAWTNLWWDYVEMQASADHLFVAWNLFDAGGNFVRSVMLRLPLKDLAEATGFSYNYYFTSDWFTFVPIAGADHSMWFASNWPATPPQNNKLRIFRWHDDGPLAAWTITVDAWTPTGRGDAQCGLAEGNWLARGDQRLQSGARYRMQGTNVKDQGRNVIAWWWNVAEGGSFAKPYIESAAFYEEDLSRPAVPYHRPYVWNPDSCFGYPSVAPNERGDLGLVMHGSSSTDLTPDILASLSDDFTSVPPGWIYYLIRKSVNRPGNEVWGDYNTSRKHIPSGVWWVGGAHWHRYKNLTVDASRPQFWFFGRGRDYNDFYRWHKR